MINKSLHTNSLEDVPQVAKQIIAFAGQCRLWWFEGNLGAGKTTLIQAICEQLGVADEVNSPTFSIINEYLDRNGNPVYHFDFYRLEDESEALDVGVEEYFYSGHFCLMEWASQIEGLVPEEHLKVDITNLGEGRREITLTIHEPEGERSV
jgi:tRNA threonylcarbamoyladenosine biosynthesis protein TsaE